jgi:hypothetical protein
MNIEDEPVMMREMSIPQINGIVIIIIAARYFPNRI